MGLTRESEIEKISRGQLIQDMQMGSFIIIEMLKFCLYKQYWPAIWCQYGIPKRLR